MDFGSHDGSLMGDDVFDEQSVDHISHCQPNSTRKRVRGGESNFNRIIFGGDSNSSITSQGEDDKNENYHPNVLQFPTNSQDSFVSQSSQDFSYQFSGLMRGEDDSNHPIHSDDTNLSNEGLSFRYPLPSCKSRVHLPPSRSTLTKNSKETDEDRRQIKLSPPLENPFLSEDDSKQARAKKRQSTLWIAPYEELPRFITDFEEVGILGAGTFSNVYAARRRLDGQVYAIKIIKASIQSVSEGNLVIREVQALAALTDCPNIVRYYGSWIDDGHLYIQTEHCKRGSLDVYVMKGKCKMIFKSEDKADIGGCDDEEEENSAPSETFSSSGIAPDSAQVVDVTSDTSKSEEVDDVGMNDDHNENSISSIVQTTGIPEALAWLILLKMSEALACMHKKAMAHLDLRPANIFVTDNDGMHTDSLANCDASQCSSNNFGSQETYITIIDEPIIVDTASLTEALLTGRCNLKLGDLGHCCLFGDTKNMNEGESRYCARELINEDGNLDLAKADMFSLGASVYELLLGRPLGSGGDGSSEWHNIRDGFLEDAQCSAELLEVLQAVMSPRPANRPSAKDVFNKAKEMLTVSLLQMRSNEDSEEVDTYDISVSAVTTS